MKNLLALTLILAAGRAGAAVLVVDFYESPNAETPFKEIRCGGPACGENGLMPLGGALVPVAYAVKVDPAGRLSVEMVRGPKLRYGLGPEPGQKLSLSDTPQSARLLWLRSKEGQNGMANDLVNRKDQELSEFWVKAKIEH